MNTLSADIKKVIGGDEYYSPSERSTSDSKSVREQPQRLAGGSGHKTTKEINMAECTCRICGKQFTAKNPRQILCSKDCKRIANAEWSRTYYRKHQAIINERKRMHTERKHIEATQKPDSIVAIGYAERQIENSLKLAGRVKI